MEDTLIQPSLPLYGKVIFVDWHGVLSHRVFWHNMLMSTDSRQSAFIRSRKELEGRCERLFGVQKDLVEEWMRGHVDSLSVLEQCGLFPSSRYSKDYYYRKLKESILELELDERLTTFLSGVRDNCFVVLATDNMDCFFENKRKIVGLCDQFDHILCSSEIGVLKTDSVEMFFGPWLRAHCLTFENAMLIDDREDNCNDFEKAGGFSFLYKDFESLPNSVNKWRNGAFNVR